MFWGIMLGTKVPEDCETGKKKTRGKKGEEGGYARSSYHTFRTQKRSKRDVERLQVTAYEPEIIHIALFICCDIMHPLSHGGPLLTLTHTHTHESWLSGVTD